MNGKPKKQDEAHLDDLLDDALAGTFPASDPVSALHAERKAPPSAGTSGRPAGDAGEQQSDQEDVREDSVDQPGHDEGRG